MQAIIINLNCRRPTSTGAGYRPKDTVKLNGFKWKPYLSEHEIPNGRTVQFTEQEPGNKGEKAKQASAVREVKCNGNSAKSFPTPKKAISQLKTSQDIFKDKFAGDAISDWIKRSTVALFRA